MPKSSHWSTSRSCVHSCGFSQIVTGRLDFDGPQGVELAAGVGDGPLGARRPAGAAPAAARAAHARACCRWWSRVRRAARRGTDDARPNWSRSTLRVAAPGTPHRRRARQRAGGGSPTRVHGRDRCSGRSGRRPAIVDRVSARSRLSGGPGSAAADRDLDAVVALVRRGRALRRPAAESRASTCSSTTCSASRFRATRSRRKRRAPTACG